MRGDTTALRCGHRCLVSCHFVIKHAGPAFVMLACTLVTGITLACFVYVLPHLLKTCSWPYVLSQLCFGLFLLANLLFNYIRCCQTDAGGTEVLVSSPEYSHVARQCRRFCQTCRRPKPPLAHHCSICNRCILRMDHHCPWMNCCIGYHNSRFFILFTFYACLGSAFAATLLLATLQAWPHARGQPDFPLTMISAFVAATAVAIALAPLLLWQMICVTCAQSTIDGPDQFWNVRDARAQGCTLVNPYNMGLRNNLQEAFDVQHLRLWWVRWLLPPARRKAGDGICFPHQPHLQAPSALDWSDAYHVLLSDRV